MLHYGTGHIAQDGSSRDLMQRSLMDVALNSLNSAVPSLVACATCSW